LPFSIPVYIYQEPVHINEFTSTYSQQIPFTQDFFDYGDLRIKGEIPRNTGYAGFKIYYPLNKTNVFDELGEFQGASYFRLLGAGQTYGQSARGLALDCGETDRSEEFPIFTDWWLGKPEKDAKELTLYAILDSVSCAGAYEFKIRPGETTIAEVNAVLYFREPDRILQANLTAPPIKTVGLAPITSMFWFGKNTERKPDDYRSEVHDSDGLMMEMANGERLWETARQSDERTASSFFRCPYPGFRPHAAGSGLSRLIRIYSLLSRTNRAPGSCHAEQIGVMVTCI
jgi:glucans biosynthesis protein